MPEAGSRTRFTLIRHGESRAHDDGVVGGPRGCRGLNELGRAQAEALRDRIDRTREVSPDVVLTSVLPRAIETAEIVGAAFPMTTDPIADCAYCELHPGECDGLTWDDYRERYGEIADPDVPMSPEGESLRSFDERVRTATNALLHTYRGQSIVVVTHGGFISAACCFMLGAPGLADFDARPFRLQPENTSITEFVSNGDDATWTLLRYNDAAHLASMYTA
jgi:2,3-bisphosphoglycerate-dependent phosphoglycerate mutase